MTIRDKYICLLLLALTVFVNATGQISAFTRRLSVREADIGNPNAGSFTPLTVGNGRFIFTTDITGLQSFPDFCERSFFKTVAEWNWLPDDRAEDNRVTQLCTIGLRVLKHSGKEISADDITDPVQSIDLWTGEIDSRFKVNGTPVHLKTVCHPDYDMISVKIVSDLLLTEQLSIRLTFPLIKYQAYNYVNQNFQSNPRILTDTNNVAIFERSGVKNDYYTLIWKNNAELRNISKNIFYLEPEHKDSVYSFSCQFMNNLENGRIQNFGETEAASRKNWGNFWNSIDDNLFRADANTLDNEIKKNLILSQYFTKIEVGSSLVPAEPGLTYNRWFGKYRLAMHWWLSDH